MHPRARLSSFPAYEKRTVTWHGKRGSTGHGAAGVMGSQGGVVVNPTFGGLGWRKGRKGEGEEENGGALMGW